MLVLDAEAVQKLHPMAESIEVMRGALRAFSAGSVVQPQRTMLRTPGGDALAVMPAYVGPSPEAPHAGFGIKMIAIKPGNPAIGLDAHLGMVLVLDERTGVPRALMDGATITAIRTAAVSAVATDVLARADAERLAVIGSGVQARSHLTAMAQVRKLSGVRVWSRNPDRAREFAAWAEQQGHPFPVEPAESVARATEDADIVCTVTGSTEPLLEADHVRDGAHINAVGSSFPDKRELSGELVARCSVFVDSRDSALVEAGDVRAPIAEGLMSPDDIRAEVGEVLLGRRAGRTDPDETTLFKSLGLAVEDVLAGFAIEGRARELGVGTEVALFAEE
ncbi:MAG TPA: ornithine cyclodeaminase family protein [Streptomyces sp.]|uniref:ornithine cyclodeaminase family protein n=1 Tax=Streptomyces sp. TaxID=1931 RepID=UPI002D63EF43|nr:ornithine cyclodeaminase family protein [Streptomyces sp.]HZG07180.1 ornithine cyclodeaminase family protein [Streptomyces sp.]